MKAKQYECLAEQTIAQGDISLEIPFFGAPELSNQEWERIVDRSKDSLNRLSLKGYRQAPFLEWALVSLDKAVSLASEGNATSSLSYLRTALKALQFTKWISKSPLLKAELSQRYKMDPGDDAIKRATSNLELVFDCCLNFLVDSKQPRLLRARLRLEDAVLSLIVVDQKGD